MLWTAIIVACLVQAPDQCRTHEIRVVAAMPTAAFIEAQSLAAQWLTLHPELEQRGRLILRPGRAA